VFGGLLNAGALLDEFGHLPLQLLCRYHLRVLDGGGALLIFFGLFGLFIAVALDRLFFTFLLFIGGFSGLPAIAAVWSVVASGIHLGSCMKLRHIVVPVSFNDLR
jgi:hypothetical protein